MSIETNNNQFDARELGVIQDARFFEPYKTELHGLFTALGLGDRWSDDPTDADFQQLLLQMIGKEHGNADDKLQFTDEQDAAARDYLRQLGMMNDHVPAPGSTFEQTIIMGGTMAANYRRTKLVQTMTDQDIDVGHVVALYGQRPREKRDGTSDEIRSTTGRFSGNDLSDNSWFAAYVDEALNSNDEWKLTETDFGRIALNKVMVGNLSPNRITLPIVAINGEPTKLAHRVDGAPARDILEYEFDDDGALRVTLLNSAAIERAGRSPRPKTKSTVGEWLERVAPDENAKVLLVSGNPHALRQTQAAYQILQEYGRGDIELVVAATSAPESTPLQTYLGEVAALIIKDTERQDSHER